MSEPTQNPIEEIATCPKCGDELVQLKQDGLWMTTCIMCQRTYTNAEIVWKPADQVPQDKRQVFDVPPDPDPAPPQPFFISPFRFNELLMIIHPVTGKDTGGRGYYVGVQATLFDGESPSQAHVAISKTGESGYTGNCAIKFTELRRA